MDADHDKTNLPKVKIELELAPALIPNADKMINFSGFNMNDYEKSKICWSCAGRSIYYPPVFSTR